LPGKLYTVAHPARIAANAVANTGSTHARIFAARTQNTFWKPPPAAVNLS
jgi:hypothetical protein